MLRIYAVFRVLKNKAVWLFWQVPCADWDKTLQVKPDFLVRHTGISLLEILLMMGLLAMIILPFTLLMSQNAQLSRSLYIQSTRSLFQSSASDQMDPLRSDYYTQFNNTTMATSLSESGQVIPFIIQVDTINSDIFKKTAYLYTYNNITDSVNAPRTIHKMFQVSDTFRLRCGNSNALMDH
jgi:Tfp pilus assembly protein PilV